MIKMRKDAFILPVLQSVAKQMFSYFCYVLTLVIILSGLIARLTDGEWVLYTRDLQRFLLVALFSVLPMTLNWLFVKNSVIGTYIIRIVQFTLTTVLVMAALILVREPGSDLDIHMVVIFFLIYIAIYAFELIIFLRNEKLAERINKELDALHQGESVTHPE